MYLPDATWLIVFAAVIVGLVAASVVPRRHNRPGFPWFWVAFPVTVLATAAALAGYAPVEFHPTMYLPLSDRDALDATWLWGLLAVIGAAASTWAWRRGRY